MIKQAKWQRLAWPVAIMGMIIVGAQIVWKQGWRVNITNSEPLGIYRIVRVSGSINRTDLVEFCPPVEVTPKRFPFYLRGDCPSGGMPMFKMVAAVPGDHLRVDMAGTWVNGRRLPFSQQLGGSRRFPLTQLPHQHGDFVLGVNRYWVYGSGARPELAAQSFDSRYWGVVDSSMIRSVLR